MTHFILRPTVRCRRVTVRFMDNLCNNGSSYGFNSTSHSDVVALPAGHAASASSSVVGFARYPDQTWGLALAPCRSDVVAREVVHEAEGGGCG